MRSSRIADVLVLGNVTAYFATYSLMTYLTYVWGLNVEQAAEIVNWWSGISYILVPLFAFVADTLTGNYIMIAISTISYPLGLGFLSMSTPFLSSSCKENQPECIGVTQKVLFYVGLVLIGIGKNGYDASALAFIQEQVDTSTENKQPKIWVRRLIFSVLLTIILYFPKTEVLQFGIPAILTLAVTILFWISSSSYKKKEALWNQGRPLTTAFRVDIDSINQLLVQYSEDRRKRYFGKDAIILPNQAGQETHSIPKKMKKEVDVIPLWITILTFIICGFVSSFGETFFQDQANNMNSHIGKLAISLEIILLVYEVAKIFSEKLIGMLEPVPQFGIEALLLSLLCCTSSASVFRRMIQVETSNSMSVFWLLPQYLLLAGLDSYMEISLEEFFKARLTPSLEIYSLHFGYAVKGVGFIASPVSVYAMRKIVGKEKNMFNMDKLYWTLATLCVAVLVLHPVIAIIQNSWKHFTGNAKDLPKHIFNEPETSISITFEENKEEAELYLLAENESKQYARSLTSTSLKKLRSFRTMSMPVA